LLKVALNTITITLILYWAITNNWSMREYTSLEQGYTHIIGDRHWLHR
jgi:hypothetical protein